MTIDYFPTVDRAHLDQAYAFIVGLDTYYPDISNWYQERVIPGVLAGDDTLLVATDNGHLIGIALLKQTGEKKLRCLRVDPSYQNLGIGIHLLDRSLELLEERKPHVTVSEEPLGLYSRAFVNRYGFSLDHVSKGRYRPLKLEYEFNHN